MTVLQYYSVLHTLKLKIINSNLIKIDFFYFLVMYYNVLLYYTLKKWSYAHE